MADEVKDKVTALKEKFKVKYMPTIQEKIDLVKEKVDRARGRTPDVREEEKKEREYVFKDKMKRGLLTNFGDGQKLQRKKYKKQNRGDASDSGSDEFKEGREELMERLDERI